MIVIADESKWVEALGAFPLPVEVTRFGFAMTARRIHEALKETACASDEVKLRTSGKANEPVITDGGNYILDAHAQRIADPAADTAAGSLGKGGEELLEDGSRPSGIGVGQGRAGGVWGAEMIEAAAMAVNRAGFAGGSNF